MILRKIDFKLFGKREVEAVHGSIQFLFSMLFSTSIQRSSGTIRTFIPRFVNPCLVSIISSERPSFGFGISVLPLHCFARMDSLPGTLTIDETVKELESEPAANAHGHRDRHQSARWTHSDGRTIPGLRGRIGGHVDHALGIHVDKGRVPFQDRNPQRAGGAELAGRADFHRRPVWHIRDAISQHAVIADQFDSEAVKPRLPGLDAICHVGGGAVYGFSHLHIGGFAYRIEYLRAGVGGDIDGAFRVHESARLEIAERCCRI